MKQIELENILSQGDIQTAIDNNNKRLDKAQEVFQCAMEEVQTLNTELPWKSPLGTF